ncbi:MAG: Sulfite exporter TauE/SafE [bacterium ADurb.Bin429]|nr:MAG: Sulfite exporter TauE/SafE [bacterium ADurb.Bin429]
MELSPLQWLYGGIAALLVGMTKTGVPGLGILVVLFLAWAFGGWNSIGIMLPMLVFADIFAVLWYKRHANWGILVRLLPWVVVGMIGGAIALRYFGQSDATKAMVNPVIGGLVLLMAILHLLERKFGEKLAPRSTAGTASAGVAAGFATTVSNAAGPIMTMYMIGQRISKEAFMGTLAWYFFTINLSKVPIYIANDLFTRQSLLIDLLAIPAILAGVFWGKWLLPRISQKAFDGVTVAFAVAGAVQLMVPPGWMAWLSQTVTALMTK